MIYAEGIDGLPPLFKDYFWRRLWEVLSGKDQDRALARLEAADRQAVLEIIADTREGLPGYWEVPATAPKGGDPEAGSGAKAPEKKRARL